MDVFNLFYYGIVCAILTWWAPKKPGQRLVAGFCTGAIAAGGLPYIRSFIF
jgi:hypothetical protein